MAKIVTITNPLTGQPAQVDQLDHTAQQIDDCLNIARWVSNPNLLDNPYFGNPVDQRQGRVVVPNTTYYSDNTLATAAGTTSAYVTAYRYATGTASGVNYASFKLEDSDTAPTYYAAPENVVRGYTGAGYGIDRWIQDGSITTLLTNDGLQIINSSDVAFGISQIFGTNYSGKTLTASILTEPGTIVVVWCNLNQIAVIPADSGGLATISFVAPTNDTSKVSFSVGKGTFLFKAIKLELGSQQTLAHKDENSNWQLNEIPDYGEQLARCQRYQLVFDNSISGFASLGQALILNSTTISVIIPTPVTVQNVGEGGPVVISGDCRLRFIYTIGNGALVQDIKPKSASVVAASQTSVILNILFDPISVPANTTGYCDLISGKIIIDRNM